MTRGTVLLVDDCEHVRRAAERILTSRGYRVVSADSGADALRVGTQQGARIALLITDLVMPQMNGRALARRLREAQPGLRALFMSGYTDQILADRGELGPDDAFMRKPFRMDELVSKVRAVLSRSESGERQERR